MGTFPTRRNEVNVDYIIGGFIIFLVGFYLGITVMAMMNIASRADERV